MTINVVDVCAEEFHGEESGVRDAGSFNVNLLGHVGMQVLRNLPSSLTLRNLLSINLLSDALVSYC